MEKRMQSKTESEHTAAPSMAQPSISTDQLRSPSQNAELMSTEPYSSFQSHTQAFRSPSNSSMAPNPSPRVASQDALQNTAPISNTSPSLENNTSRNLSLVEDCLVQYGYQDLITHGKLSEYVEFMLKSDGMRYQCALLDRFLGTHGYRGRDMHGSLSEFVRAMEDDTDPFVNGVGYTFGERNIGVNFNSSISRIPAMIPSAGRSGVHHSHGVNSNKHPVGYSNNSSEAKQALSQSKKDIGARSFINALKSTTTQLQKPGGKRDGLTLSGPTSRKRSLASYQDPPVLPKKSSSGAPRQNKRQPPKAPAWLIHALNELKKFYPDDMFRAIMVFPVAIQAHIPRIRCDDCPKHCYYTGPQNTVIDFTNHLNNRQHRENVDARIESGPLVASQTLQAASSNSTITQPSPSKSHLVDNPFQRLLQASPNTATLRGGHFVSVGPIGTLLSPSMTAGFPQHSLRARLRQETVLQHPKPIAGLLNDYTIGRIYQPLPASRKPNAAQRQISHTQHHQSAPSNTSEKAADNSPLPSQFLQALASSKDSCGLVHSTSLSSGQSTAVSSQRQSEIPTGPPSLKRKRLSPGFAAAINSGLVPSDKEKSSQSQQVEKEGKLLLLKHDKNVVWENNPAILELRHTGKHDENIEMQDSASILMMSQRDLA